MHAHERIASDVSEYVQKIRGLAPQIDEVAGPYRIGIGSENEPILDKTSADDCVKGAVGDGLVKLRLLTENNFHALETLSLLATTRYVFELSVWFRLFKKDRRYGLICFREWLHAMLRHHSDSLTQLNAEVAILKSFEVLDKNRLPGKIPSEQMNEVDALASRKFSVYCDDARTNGYGFQAWLVETKAIPHAEAAIKEAEKEIALFTSSVPIETQNMVKGKWQWRAMATVAGIADEHDYLYSYTSKLLHATPVSFQTDQKNLELVEIRIFLRYIHVKIQEMLDIARTLPVV